MNDYLRRLTLVFLLLTAGAVHASLPGPLIEADWLMRNISTDAVRVLDIQEGELFLQHHLPGAVNWPFSQWRTDDKARPPKSLPPLEKVAARLGDLGIAESTPLVIVSTGTGPGDLAAAARVYWTLKVLGHQQVAILNGGLVSYVNEYGGSFVRGGAEPRTPVSYKAKPNLELLATAQWIMNSAVPRLDARTLGEKVGVMTGEGEQPGTIPGAKHLPFDWLANDAGKIRPLKELKTLFAHAGVPDGGAVHFCHTANRASLSWFVDYALLGNQQARLYDGSMIEWGKDKTLPMETEVRL